MSKHVILLKSNLGARGGLEKYTLRSAKAFVQANCKVTILTSSSKKNTLPKIDGINIVSLFEQSSLSALNLYRFDLACTKWLKSHSYDLIFGFDRNRHQTLYRAGNGVHASYLESRTRAEGFFKKLSFSINPLHRLILHFERCCFEDPELKVLFTNSHFVKKDILKKYKTTPNKIHVIHNGVEWDEFKNDFDNWSKLRSAKLKQFGLDETQFQLLFIGHGYKRKGLDLLLNALATIKDHCFQLSVVGKDKHLSFFKKLSLKLGLSDKVLFFAEQSHTTPFYQCADALVIPSTYDPFANVTIEALAMGLFVLSSATNGGHEVLTPDSGLVIRDVYDRALFAKDLKATFKMIKTEESSWRIRESVKNLNFAHQLNHLIEESLHAT